MSFGGLGDSMDNPYILLVIVELFFLMKAFFCGFFKDNNVVDAL